MSAQPTGHWIVRGQSDGMFWIEAKGAYGASIVIAQDIASEATALMIASAPLMLENLKRLVFKIDGVDGSPSVGEMDEARAAIAVLTAHRVIEILATKGVTATYEDQPGFIAISDNSGTIAIGTINGEWAWDYTDADGHTVAIDGGPGPLPLTSAAENVAAMIVSVVAFLKGGAK